MARRNLSRVLEHPTPGCHTPMRQQTFDGRESVDTEADGPDQDHTDPRTHRTGFEGERKRTLATDGGEELPEITHHVEPPEVGGETYARCEGCGSEQIHGPEHILHDDDCPHAADWQADDEPAEVA